MPSPLFAVLARPGKYAEEVSIDRCFAVGETNEKKVWKIARAYLKGKRFKPLVGVAHPTKDRIVIADGHHRFEAYLVLKDMIGLEKIQVGVSDDFYYYPIFAAGLNQLTPKWQEKWRKKLRNWKYRLTGKTEDDWDV